MLAIGVDGIIATNTTVRARASTPESEVTAIGNGGLSGAPLMNQATTVLRKLRTRLPDSIPVIGVGGILSGADAVAKIVGGHVAGAVLHRTGLSRSGTRWRMRGGDTPPARAPQHRRGSASMISPWRATADADLRSRNTFGVAARAPLLVEVQDHRALGEVLALPGMRDALPLVLGGGSNLLFAADPVAPLLAFDTHEVAIVDDDGQVSPSAGRRRRPLARAGDADPGPGPDGAGRTCR